MDSDGDGINDADDSDDDNDGLDDDGMDVIKKQLKKPSSVKYLEELELASVWWNIKAMLFIMMIIFVYDEDDDGDGVDDEDEDWDGDGLTNEGNVHFIYIGIYFLRIMM